jgi:hypothetical protein
VAAVALFWRQVTTSTGEFAPLVRASQYFARCWLHKMDPLAQGAADGLEFAVAVCRLRERAQKPLAIEEVPDLGDCARGSPSRATAYPTSLTALCLRSTAVELEQRAKEMDATRRVSGSRTKEAR